MAKKKSPASRQLTEVAYSALLISDCHHPYVDQAAWNLLLNVANYMAPEHVVIMGDFADCYAVSDHRKDPRRERNFAREIEGARKALGELVQAVGAKSKRKYVKGNHEDRLPRYLADRAPELYDVVEIEDLVGLDESWEVTEYRDYTKIGKLHLTHDVDRCGKNAIMQSLADFGGNLAFAHSHRGGTGYMGNIRGEQHVCLNVGHLSDLAKVDYKHKAKAKREWQLGFGWADFDVSGNCWAQFIPIVGNHCCVNGVMVKA